MSNQPLRIFVGYDPVEAIAYHVCCNSILEHASQPVSFTPIGLKNLPRSCQRPRGPKDSTEFAISRFLTPWFGDFQGWALFIDCDMLFLGDVVELFGEADPEKAVSVVKHDYVPKATRKFLNQTQTTYEKKNWSSVMLFNNSDCGKLTLDYVAGAPGLDLHQFKWLDDDQIGELHPKWNFLVGEYPKSSCALNLHYTLGGPYFEEFADCEYAEEWMAALAKASAPM